MSNGSKSPRLNAVALQNELPQPWRHLEVVEETGSTNSDLLARAATGEDINGIVLIAEHQTAGRGRTGRTWLSSPHSQITMSLGVGAAGVAADGWGWLPLATGVAVVDALAPLTGTSIGLKWPNDVLAGDGKLAGILAEVASPKPTIVVGIGINVVGHPDEAAVALADLGAATSDRNELIPSLLHELGARIERWREAGGADDRLIADYRSRSVTISSRVRALLPGGGEIVGTATSIDAQGRLLIDSGDQNVAVSAGDVVHLRH
jgi:BirA family biotin operon repressor/biotin-[acetyl-CoA-carboxylase] ligase